MVRTLDLEQLRIIATRARPPARPRRARRPGKPLVPLVDCQIDGLRLAGHLRCSQCRILIGPGHVEVDAVGSRCRRCAERPR